VILHVSEYERLLAPAGELQQEALRLLVVHRRRHRHHGLSLHAPHVAEEQLPYRVTLVYSNRDRESACGVR